MADQTAVDFADFVKKHTSALKKYAVVVAHENSNGDGQVGSGVLVNINQRHFIATAAHCIKHEPVVVHNEFFTEKHKGTGKIRIGTDKPIRILNRGWHPKLDIGFLEISASPSLEITEDQLGSKVILGGCVHVIGYPVCMIEEFPAQKRLNLNKVPIGTNILEIADTFLKLDYPREGKHAEGGEWVSGPFPTTPHGFSGGGCFGVNRTIRTSLQGLEIIEYKLLGIQYEWHEGERWIKAVPIKHWLDLVKQVL